MLAYHNSPETKTSFLLALARHHQRTREHALFDRACKTCARCYGVSFIETEDLFRDLAIAVTGASGYSDGPNYWRYERWYGIPTGLLALTACIYSVSPSHAALPFLQRVFGSLS